MSRSISPKKQQKRWNKKFQELKEYQKKHGNTNVPLKYIHNADLGLWVSDQRNDKNSSLLDLTQIAKLYSIGFDWELTSRPSNEMIWNQRFRELEEYASRFGSCNVPKNYINNADLGKWVHQQRQNRKRMDSERRRKLDSIAFGWTSSSAYSSGGDFWKERFQELKDYKNSYGHCNVPQQYKSNPALGAWVLNQRVSRQRMDKQRVAALESLGLTWTRTRGSPKKEVLWNKRFRELQEYKSFHGDCNVPVAYNENPQLGIWVSYQRAARKNMPEERRKMLDDINFAWKAQHGPSRDEEGEEKESSREKRRINNDEALDQSGTGEEKKLAANRILPTWMYTKEIRPRFEQDIARLEEDCHQKQLAAKSINEQLMTVGKFQESDFKNQKESFLQQQYVAAFKDILASEKSILHRYRLQQDEIDELNNKQDDFFQQLDEEARLQILKLKSHEEKNARLRKLLGS